jgi:hypothetical protein
LDKRPVRGKARSQRLFALIEILSVGDAGCPHLADSVEEVGE